MAFLAYSLLTPEARQRIDQILRAHPDYVPILSKGASDAPWDVSRNAFVTASVWPDVIRNDPRFSDDGKSAPAGGFSDSGRHADWHYINIPWPDEFSNQPVPSVNAVTRLKALLKKLEPSGPVDSGMAYALPWVLHIVTDLHQPLHAVTRFAEVGGKPEHDKGGNWCYVEPGRNLHSFWDGVLGRDDSENAVARLAASLMDETPRPTKLNIKPETWLAEAMALAPIVYGFNDCSKKGEPALLSPEYREKARRIARARAALGAYRLARVLNSRLGK
jgi:hypothetical protein